MNLWYIPSLIGTAYFLYVKVLDWRKSSLQPLHTNKEATKSSRISSGPLKGYFSLKKSLLKNGIAVGVAWACVIFMHPAAAFVLGAMAVFMHIVVAKDIKRMKKKFDAQRVVLQAIKAGTRTSITVDEQHNNDNKPIYIAEPSFWDVRTDADPIAMFTDLDERVRAKAELFMVLRGIASKPESEWFQVGRAE